MKKISYKKILLIIIVVLLIFSISTISFASLVDIEPVIKDGGAKVKSVAGVILGIIQVVAGAVAVIMLVVLAIKYIAASPSEKADVKKGLTVYIIGALILFAGAGILNIIQALATDINTQTTISGGGGTWV